MPLFSRRGYIRSWYMHDFAFLFFVAVVSCFVCFLSFLFPFKDVRACLASADEITHGKTLIIAHTMTTTSTTELHHQARLFMHALHSNVHVCIATRGIDASHFAVRHAIVYTVVCSLSWLYQRRHAQPMYQTKTHAYTFCTIDNMICWYRTRYTFHLP